MKYIHVKNLEKYQPGYKDRNAIWAKIYCQTLFDPDTKLLSEPNFARYIRLILMETYLKKPIPATEKYLSSIGFDFGLESLASTLNELSQMIEIINVTEIGKVLYPRKEKNREEKKEDIVNADEKTVVVTPFPRQLFELYKTTTKNLPQPSEFTRDRERKCHLRLRERGLSDWQAIFERMDKTPFLLGENQRGWRATFDWIIANETNSAKVLEGKYDPKLKPKTADDVLREVFRDEPKR